MLHLRANTRPMTTRTRESTVRRPSLPLTARDEADLAVLRDSEPSRQALARLTGIPTYSSTVSEATLLHAVFTAGLGALRQEAEEAGYAEIAAQQDAAEIAAQRRQARRRSPSWAHEA